MQNALPAFPVMVRSGTSTEPEVRWWYRRRGGVEGIYRCVIPDAVNVIQTIYIGVYSASTGECMGNHIALN